MKSKTFHLVSLGCAKNNVDSDGMAQLLIRDGFRSVDLPDEAEVLIVNTCGFIGPAREESYQVLQELSKLKGEDQFLIAAGCLTQRYGREVAAKVPRVDGILGTRRWMDILQLVRKLRKGHHPEPVYHLPEATNVSSNELTLSGSLAGASAYLKIADGCRRPCAFCAIPLIKGSTVSRPMELLLRDAKVLQDSGAREINLIAQDTTDYGHDLGLQDGLALLLENLVKHAPDVSWWRILYAYPGYVTDRLIDCMAEISNILPYLDMPLQHAHPETLKRMKRPTNIDWVHKTLARMRERIPNLAIRTTFIVGYPGETEEEFQSLLDFVKEIRFDRVGAFKYSFEQGTSGEILGDPISAEIKEERYQRLMELQQGISLQINQGFTGRELDVLVEGRDKGFSIGRSYRDAPEIDGLVFIEGKARVGEIQPVRITGAMAYDLSASLI